MIVLLVGMAEIYLALSWDENMANGKWNVTLKWALLRGEAQPETPSSSWSQYFFISQKPSNNIIINATLPEDQIL
ncbi:hypothetical protein J6590_006060 [Homalodisca vitripennis]|nr:hypothetical protein J6590_006060 [Homalodisca vitripennis]